ncbi:hypothetical protein TNCV_149921 [Trichonephila clavipes]|nr:hypothetical protein TNCV_149921 [Trichonephila clavipes]
MNTQDNTLWQCQKYFRKKRSDIPSLNNTAITDEQKAELLVETFQSNFTDNIRPANFNTNIDALVTNTLENFFTNPPSTPITPTDPIEIIKAANQIPVHFSPSSNRKELTQLLQDELFPTSNFNKLHLSPTSQRKPGCFSSSRTLTLPGTINIYDMGWRLASRAICPATDYCVTPLLLPATTSVTTILQPANQVASCSPSRNGN